MVLTSAKDAAKTHQKHMVDSTIFRDLSPISVFCALTLKWGFHSQSWKGKLLQVAGKGHNRICLVLRGFFLILLFQVFI